MKLERVAAVAVTAVGILICIGMAGTSTVPPPPPQLSDPKTATSNTVASSLPHPWRASKLRPEHEVLASLVGKGTASVHVEEGPFPRAKDSLGNADAKLVLGGLFVEVTHSEVRMKEPYERVILYGFDQAIGKYTADVFQTTSPAVIHFIGTYDAGKKQFDMTAKYSDQSSRRYVTSRLVTTLVDAKTWSYEEFFTAAADKPEKKVVSVTLKRS